LSRRRLARSSDRRIDRFIIGCQFLSLAKGCCRCCSRLVQHATGLGRKLCMWGRPPAAPDRVGFWRLEIFFDQRRRVVNVAAKECERSLPVPQFQSICPLKYSVSICRPSEISQCQETKKPPVQCTERR
jgi:hypothetical protein